MITINLRKSKQNGRLWTPKRKRTINKNTRLNFNNTKRNLKNGLRKIMLSRIMKRRKRLNQGRKKSLKNLGESKLRRRK
jgi:hypothetical protein